MTASVRDAIVGERGSRFEDLGLTQLRNVAKPVHIFRVLRSG